LCDSVIMFYCSYSRPSFYGQLLQQLQCCLTVHPYWLCSVTSCYCLLLARKLWRWCLWCSRAYSAIVIAHLTWFFIYIINEMKWNCWTLPFSLLIFRWYQWTMLPLTNQAVMQRWHHWSYAADSLHAGLSTRSCMFSAWLATAYLVTTGTPMLAMCWCTSTAVSIPLSTPPSMVSFRMAWDVWWLISLESHCRIPKAVRWCHNLHRLRAPPSPEMERPVDFSFPRPSFLTHFFFITTVLLVF